MAKLAPGYQDLDKPETYPVRYTARLEALIAKG